jgi:hypothetical protein
MVPVVSFTLTVPDAAPDVLKEWVTEAAVEVPPFENDQL